MNIIKAHQKIFAERYILDLIGLCNIIYENDHNREPTEEEQRAFAIGHLCGKEKIFTKEDAKEIFKYV